MSIITRMLKQKCTYWPPGSEASGGFDFDDYDVTRLELIERWLSAHVYTIRDMRASEERAGTVSERKQSMVGLGFDTSHYGQMAMRLDTKGGLAALNARIKKGTGQTVQISWLGDNDYNPA